MGMIQSSRILELARALNPKEALIDAVDVSEIETFGENLLVATYIRPEKTKGGVYRPESNVKEDEFQGNVGLVVQVGTALKEEESDWLHHWVIFGYNDGLKWRYNDVPVRYISIERIRGTVEDPSRVI